MRVDLVELLHTREICHPSRFASFKSACDGSMQIEVVGNPWWREKHVTGEEGRLTLLFDGVKEGCVFFELFHSQSTDDALEVFRVTPLSEAKWNRGVLSEVFCNAPLRDPIAVYTAITEFLDADICPHGPFQFLNAEGVSRFLKLARENSFLICRAPEAVCNVVCEALANQRANFNVVRSSRSESKDGVFVELASARFACAAAYAVFE